MVSIAVRRSILLLLLSISSLKAQLLLKNQTEYTYWQEDDQSVWENWTDLTYQYNYLRGGIRLEVNNPPDPYIFNEPDLLQKNELAYRFLELNYKSLQARLGNFYATFGRGLILRTYEDRNLRVDNNIDGVQLKYKKKRLNLQVLSGNLRDEYNRRNEIIYGIDGTYNVLKPLQLGGSFLLQNNKTETVRIAAIRSLYSRKWWDLYLELAKPETSSKLSGYFALSAALHQVALTFEYKDYNNLYVTNRYNIDYAAAPALTREHSFTLLNRHPHFLNMNDEKGYQLEVLWETEERWQMAFNHALTKSHAGQRIFEEYYAELDFIFSERFESAFAFDWSYDAATSTDNLTPLADIYYSLDGRNQFHFSIQHQHTRNKIDQSEYDTDLVLVEYSHSPWLTMAIAGEYTNKDQLNNVELERSRWIYGNIIFSFKGRHQLSLLYGSRQEGFVCVGGVCRYEPEFSGIEIKLSNRF